MARTELPIIVLHPTTGNYVEGAEVEVSKRPSGDAAPVWDAESGGSEITQPLASDAEGRVTGWVDRGRYQIVITVAGSSPTTVYYDSSPAADQAVDTDWIQDNAVTRVKIGDDAVGPDELDEGTVDTVHIVDGAVKTAQIGDSAVTTAKIQTDAITATRLRDDSVTDSNRAVTTDHIRDGAVTTIKIADDSITLDKLAPRAGNITPTFTTLDNGTPSSWQNWFSFTASQGTGYYSIRASLLWLDNYASNGLMTVATRIVTGIFTLDKAESTLYIGSDTGLKLTHKHYAEALLSSGATVTVQVFNTTGVFGSVRYFGSAATTPSSLVARRTDV